MIFIKGISKFNRPLKSYMVELKYGSSERNVTLELFDTEFNKSYTIGLNKLISEYYTRNTEWDIRGAMLYLTWTANGKTTMLNLYHTAR